MSKNMEKVRQDISYTQQISKGYKTEYYQKWEVGKDLETFTHSWWKCRLVKRFWRLIFYFDISVYSPTYSILFFFLHPTPYLSILDVVYSQYYGTTVKSEGFVYIVYYFTSHISNGVYNIEKFRIYF